MERGHHTDMVQSLAVPAWAPWPLRLFLGGSFVWASVDKLLDAGFLNAAAPGYVGHQLAAGAAASPIGALTTALVVPNAQFFGALVMAGELLIGLAVLLGWYTRFSAALGLLINLMFFLTISWEVQPFYFGADLPYAVGWLTLLLIGPGALSVDAALRRVVPAPLVSGSVVQMKGAISRRRFNALVGGGIAAALIGGLESVGWPLLHGGTKAAGAGNAPTPAPAPDGAATSSAVAVADSPTAAPSEPTTAVAAADPLTATVANPATADVPYSTPILSADSEATLTAQPTALPTDVPTLTPTEVLTAVPPTSTAVPTAGPAAPTEIPITAAVAPTKVPIAPTKAPPTPTKVPAAPTKALVVPTKAPTAVAGKKLLVGPDQIAVNESLPFTALGKPAVLVRLASGYVAYSAVCTHEGCTVVYKGATQHLVCPCHSAQFDPAAQAAVLRGPARRPLAAIAITVAPDGSVYLA